MHRYPKLFRCVLAMILSLVFIGSSEAEEGGSGHYLSGSMASFVDGVPAKPTFLLRYNLLNYSGSFERNEPLPIAGITAENLDVDSWAHGLTAVWRPNWNINSTEEMPVGHRRNAWLATLVAQLKAHGATFKKYPPKDVGLGM